MRTIKEQLRTSLFLRVNRALQLTQTGQRLFKATDEALRTIDSAAAQVAGTSRSLALTTTVALASTWLVPLLPRFTRQHPEL
ncbi:MAG: LysR family transcriptional regulator, partial [Aquincola sp.]|nr:LysR family transcriptional regulator [Aquincola sp.]